MTRDEFTRRALSHLEELAAYARRLTRHSWDADDLVQATYERAFRKWRSLDDLAGLRAWLFQVERRVHIDRVRAVSARPELRLVRKSDGISAPPVVAPETVERLTAHALEAALEELSDEQREALLLCDLWGFHYEEIAQITAVPVGTVRSRISRARRAMCTMLAEHGEGDAAKGADHGA